MGDKRFIRDGQGLYRVPGTLSADDIVAQAMKITAARMRKGANALSSPQKVREYLSLHLAQEEQELFWAVYLDNRHRVISHEVLFRGTIDGASVYPREVVKAALGCNAAAVIFAHNHPSGVAEPSVADTNITRKLIDSLALVDMRVLDHLIVGENITSMAERGLL